MDIQTRKLNLIHEFLGLTNEETLIQLERVLQSEKKKSTTKSSFKDFLGVITEEEASAMESEIEAACGQIQDGDWK